jgi:hypothetical protein
VLLRFTKKGLGARALDVKAKLALLGIRVSVKK